MNVPVIASGGVGTLEHLTEGIVQGRADAVLAASIFHFGEHTVAEAKAHMAAAGVTVRPSAEAVTAPTLSAPLVRAPFTVLDGGLSTALDLAGHDLNDPLWTARLLADEPRALVDAHLLYLRAGADVVITASYQRAWRDSSEPATRPRWPGV